MSMGTGSFLDVGFLCKMIETSVISINLVRGACYRPQRSCGQGNIFNTCLSFCSQGGGFCLSACWDTPPPGRHPPRIRHHPPDQTPPLPECILGYCCFRSDPFLAQTATQRMSKAMYRKNNSRRFLQRGQ